MAFLRRSRAYEPAADILVEIHNRNPNIEESPVRRAEDFSCNKTPSGGAPQPLVGSELHP